MLLTGTPKHTKQLHGDANSQEGRTEQPRTESCDRRPPRKSGDGHTPGAGHPGVMDVTQGGMQAVGQRSSRVVTCRSEDLPRAPHQLADRLYDEGCPGAKHFHQPPLPISLRSASAFIICCGCRCSCFKNCTAAAFPSLSQMEQACGFVSSLQGVNGGLMLQIEAQ